MTEPAYMGCLRVDAEVDPYPGSTQIVCAHCGTAIWISPVSKRAIDEQGITPVCMACLAIVALEAGKNAKFGVLPGTITEVANWFRRN